MPKLGIAFANQVALAKKAKPVAPVAPSAPAAPPARPRMPLGGGVARAMGGKVPPGFQRAPGQQKPPGMPARPGAGPGRIAGIKPNKFKVR